MGEAVERWRYIGRQPTSLASGRPLALGDVLTREDFTYDDDDALVPDDQRLVNEGLLVDAAEAEDYDPALEDELKGEALDQALEQRGLAKSGTAGEKRERVAEYDAAQSEEG